MYHSISMYIASLNALFLIYIYTNKYPAYQPTDAGVHHTLLPGRPLRQSAPGNFLGPGTLFHYFVLTLGCFYVGVFPSQFFFTKVFSQLFFFQTTVPTKQKKPGLNLERTWNLRHIRGRHGPNNWATWEALSTIWLLPFSYIFADISRRMWKSKFWSVNFLI